MQALDYFVTKSGDTITFYIDEHSNRVFYKIIQDSLYSSYSFYDGEELDTAVDLFYSLLLAFIDLSAAEQFKKKVLIYQKDQEDARDLQRLKMEPLFLGNGDYSFKGY